MAIAAVLCVATVQAQTAEEIINHHIDAIGGKDVLMKIKSIYLEGNANVMGNDYPTKTTIVVGKAFKNVTTANGTDIVQCITDSSGWMINPMSGASDPTPLPPDAVKKGQSSLDIGGELFNFKDKGFADSLLGRETYNNVSTYKIKLSKPDEEYVYYIDPTTYYILKSETKITYAGNDATSTKSYFDYKKTDIGYVVPYAVAVNNMGYDVTLSYNKVDINPEVDPKIFDMPK